jgi:toxin secretion/phage lysis holin
MLVGSIMGMLFGTVKPMMIVLILFIGIDYVTGIAKGIIFKNLSSKLALNGLYKKLLILLIMTVTALIDLYIVKTGAVLLSGVALYYISIEGISIIENSAAVGVPIPSRLKEVLAHLHDSDKPPDVNDK